MTGYRSELSRLHWTAEGKKSLLRSLEEPQRRANTQPRQALRTALATIAAACLLVVGVGAAVVNLPVLQRYFGGGAGYEQSSTFIGKSVAAGGWTMTLTDCVGDDRRLYLGFALEAPEGTVLNEEYYPLEETTEFSQTGRPNALYWATLPDEDPTDNKMSLALWIEYIQPKKGDSGLLGQTLTLRLEGFGYYSDRLPEETTNRVALCDGVWDFGTLDLSTIHRTIRMEPNIPVEIKGLSAAVTWLELSPTGVNVWFEGEALRNHEASGLFPWGSCINAPEITLYDKSGSPIDQGQPPFGKRGGSGCDPDPDAPDLPWINVVQTYESLLDMEDLGRIEICGVSIPLS